MVDDARGGDGIWIKQGVDGDWYFVWYEDELYFI